MEQYLVIIRGAPASGKTTIARELRDFGKKLSGLRLITLRNSFRTMSHRKYKSLWTKALLLLWNIC